MKRSYLITGVLYVAAGVLLLAAAALTENRLGALLFGFGFAGIGPGVVMMGRYWYWTRPERQARYQERLEAERIELRDELNQKLNDRAGRYAYLAGLGVTALAIVVVSLLTVLEVIPCGRLMVLYLGGYLLLQVVLGRVFYRRLRKQY
nr:hypothetical protein [uncultured Dysosmobacter sp.]